MGLRTRVIAVLTLVVLVVAALSYAVGSSIAARAVETRESLEVQGTLSRANSALAEETQHLVRTSRDWAKWDDTYAFMGERNDSYIKSNLSGTALSALDVDFMVYLDETDTPVAAIQKGSNGSRVRELDADILAYLMGGPIIAAAHEAEGKHAGLVSPEGRPALIAMQQILHSDGSGPSRGTFIVGQFVGLTQEAAISGMVGERVTLAPVTAPGSGWHAPQPGADFLTKHEDETTIQGRRTLIGLDGEPAAVVTISQSRTSRLLVGNSLRLIALAYLAAVGLLIAVIVAVLDQTVLRRLARLGSDVRAIAASRSADVRVHVSGNDEITAVARGLNDMLASLHEYQTEVRYLAEHDVLTGLANRRRFEQELEKQLSSYRRFGRGFAILWLDLDHFKDVNDSFGHAAGDQLLALLAETLRHESRDYTSVARIGGDEFAILIPEAGEQEAMGAAERIVSYIEHAEFEIVGRRPHVHVSVGVALCPTDATSADALLACADLAMYHAKSAGGNRACLYSSEAHEQLNERVAWAERVTAALAQNRFTLLAMPTMNLKTGSPGSYELLLRMIDEEGRLISPTAFIAAAESSALINQLDMWVLRTALGLIRHEQQHGRSTAFAVNLSAAGMNNAALGGLLRDAIDKGIDASRLLIEVTETAAITDLEKAKRFMEPLRELGCRFALDDFGTGTASFYYLKHLPVDVLKIDGGLIRGLGRPEGDQYFVKAIVEMCHGLGITTVAEYVENDVTLAHVRAAGIDFAQGFVISQPQPLETFGIGPKARTGTPKAPLDFGSVVAHLAKSR